MASSRAETAGCTVKSVAFSAVRRGEQRLGPYLLKQNPNTGRVHTSLPLPSRSRTTGWETRGRSTSTACDGCVTIDSARLEGVDAVGKIRDVLGPTDPSKAPPGSIRREFGQTIMVNAAHASDSEENARREMKIIRVGENAFRRVIENFYGNCWNWVDGFNIGIVANRDAFVSNNDADFADNTSTNYTDLGITMASGNGYVQNIADVPGAFLPNDTTGASSSTYLTDYFYQNTGNLLAIFGGSADGGARAGAFFWGVHLSSAFADRLVGARLAY